MDDNLVHFVDKFCIDIDDQKQMLESLINDPEVIILDKRIFMSQGTNPKAYVLLEWAKEDLD